MRVWGWGLDTCLAHQHLLPYNLNPPTPDPKPQPQSGIRGGGGTPTPPPKTKFRLNPTPSTPLPPKPNTLNNPRNPKPGFVFWGGGGCNLDLHSGLAEGREDRIALCLGRHVLLGLAVTPMHLTNRTVSWYRPARSRPNPGMNPARSSHLDLHPGFTEGRQHRIALCLGRNILPGFAITPRGYRERSPLRLVDGESVSGVPR